MLKCGVDGKDHWAFHKRYQSGYWKSSGKSEVDDVSYSSNAAAGETQGVKLEREAVVWAELCL